MRKYKRFDHVWRDILTEHNHVTSKLCNVADAHKALRRYVYRLAAAALAAKSKFHNELLEQIEGQTLVEWEDMMFSTAEEVLQITRHDLYKALENGLAERSFTARGIAEIVKVNRPDGAKQGQRVRPSIRRFDSPEDEVKFLRSELEVVRVELKQVRIELDELRRAMRRVKKASALG